MSLYPNTYTFLPLLRAPAPSYSITINVAARRLTLFKNGTVFKSYPIAVGKPKDLVPASKLMILQYIFNKKTEKPGEKLTSSDFN